MSAVLITGANRGIGLALAKLYSEDPTTKVIATTRSLANAKQLEALGRKNIHIITLDFEESLPQIKTSLEAIDKIAPEGVDVVIHNSGAAFGLNKEGQTPVNTSIDDFARNFTTNTFGTVKVFQAVYPYWIKNTGNVKKLVFISSAAGWINNHIPINSFGYGGSKAALNHYVKEVGIYHSASENETLKSSVSVAVHPGVVTTDMAGDFIAANGITDYISPQQSAEHIKKLVDELKPEDNGTFKTYTGDSISW